MSESVAFLYPKSDTWYQTSDIKSGLLSFVR
jgi:hypothetical protein